MTNYQDKLSNLLKNIPKSNQDSQPLEALVAVDSNTYAILFGYLQFLKHLGVVEINGTDSISQSQIRATSQTAKYLLNSLADYVEHELPLIRDWETRGLQESPFANGASFLYQLEKRRFDQFDNPNPTRHSKVANVLIKRDNPQNEQPEILMQFDDKAGQFQLIGGRWRESDGADLLATMIRELEEELPLNQMKYEQNYSLAKIADITPPLTLSPTFGALTQYELSIYHCRDLETNLVLQPIDQWISIEAVLGNQITVDERDYPFHSPETYQLIDESLPNGLIGLSSSFKADTT